MKAVSTYTAHTQILWMITVIGALLSDINHITCSAKEALLANTDAAAGDASTMTCTISSSKTHLLIANNTLEARIANASARSSAGTVT
jgi:hypothetical protein